MKNPLTLDEIKNPFFRSAFKKISGIGTLESWYDKWIKDYEHSHGDPDKFIDFTLNQLDVTASLVDPESIKHVPSNGPLIIVANHPLGGLEGMLLTKMLRTVRPDLKVLTNELLKIFPEFEDIFIGADILNEGKQRENAQSMRAMAKHLSGGGALLIFPSGTVSHMELPSFNIVDIEWNTLVSRFARKFKAPILPIFVDGRNSLSFYFCGLISAKLRTVILPRAMIGRSGHDIPVHIGPLISDESIREIPDEEEATRHIRARCEALRNTA